MCKSVPQIEAARTRTSTSFGPIVGMETASSCAPRSGRIFRKAFIVAVGIRKPCDEPVEPSGGRGRKSDVNTRHTTPEAATKPGDAQARFRYNRPRLGSSPNRVRPIRGNTQESPCLFERRVAKLRLGATLGRPQGGLSEFCAAPARDSRWLSASFLGGPHHLAVRAAVVLPGFCFS